VEAGVEFFNSKQNKTKATKKMEKKEREKSIAESHMAEPRVERGQSGSENPEAKYWEPARTLRFPALLVPVHYSVTRRI
jgi:hypothetical protein